MFKSNKGFTLVELIVVIAILAILAGVAIPVYNGYIKRAQDAAVVTELDAIATAAQAANAISGEVTLIVVDGTTIEVGGADNKLSGNFDDDFILFYGDATATGSLGKFNATIDLGNATYKDGAYWDGEWKAGTKDVPNQEAGFSLGGSGGVSEEPEVVNPLDPNCTHTWGEWTVTKAATCVAGEQKRTCSTCGGWETETIAAIAQHKWTAECDDTCDNDCGTTRTPSTAHTFVDGECTGCGRDEWETDD